MGFFKKLKERLFALETPSKTSTAVAPTAPVSKPDASTTKLAKAQKKLDRKVAQESKKQQKVSRYITGMAKSGDTFARAIKEIQARHNQIDEALFDDLEEALILADIAVPLVNQMLDEIRREVRIENVTDPKQIAEIIADKLFAIYVAQDIVDTGLAIEDGRINVILMVGVNGVGKTTTIAKLAHRFILEGKKVLIAAADTFRAGAVAQLQVWADRVGAGIVTPMKDGADPASVVFDAIARAQKEQVDILIVDTAGRLQNKVNLMNELEKMSRILSREIAGAPHESLLVLDATTGQNGVMQAVAFREVTPLTGIVLTKMDGTSKGGIVLTIRDRLGLAVKLLGLGETLDDLQEFDLDAFIYGLTKGLEN